VNQVKERYANAVKSVGQVHAMDTSPRPLFDFIGQHEQQTAKGKGGDLKPKGKPSNDSEWLKIDYNPKSKEIQGFNSMLKYLISVGEWEKVDPILNDLQQSGAEPNELTHSLVCLSEANSYLGLPICFKYRPQKSGS